MSDADRTDAQACGEHEHSTADDEAISQNQLPSRNPRSVDFF
jgi:hypothetical protein